ncbi:MAG: hypothetical protein JXA90_04980, partial [Planctomycetes bacterium]|nr:hypothetical protein [Planctomycetota bacterium]
PACPRCGGRGMILAAGVVETTYRSADLIEASGGRALPRWLARSTEGSRLFWDFLSEPALHRDDAARKKSVNAVAEHFGPEVEKRVASEIFSESTATAGAPGERRLIRMSIEIISLPAMAFECRLLDAGPGALGAEISVWMVGSGRRLRACGVPRVWTWKAAGWIAGLAACGVPLGMALVKALALFL